MQKPQSSCRQKPNFHILAPKSWEHYLEKPGNLLDQTTLDPALVIITVLSTSPGKIKSLTALHLAECFANDGYKTLLLEADIRTPRFHTLFNFECTKGLTDTIKNNTGHITAYKDNLDVLSAGTAIKEATTFLLGRQFKQFIHALKGLYDKIIIDTPALSDHKDALIVRDYACGSIIVHDAQAAS